MEFETKVAINQVCDTFDEYCVANVLDQKCQREKQNKPHDLAFTEKIFKMCKIFQAIDATFINAIVDTANHLWDKSTFVRVFALKNVCILYNSINDLLKYCTNVVNNNLLLLKSIIRCNAKVVYMEWLLYTTNTSINCECRQTKRKVQIFSIYITSEQMMLIALNSILLQWLHSWALSMSTIARA